ncbi:hypothetical protein AA313_de0206788 [Arthrobotrys entomopaga]|nr:hypothetical protein AA313_de0206788 [Arthrobotrys entomopaga]
MKTSSLLSAVLLATTATAVPTFKLNFAKRGAPADAEAMVPPPMMMAKNTTMRASNTTISVSVDIGNTTNTANFDTSGKPVPSSAVSLPIPSASVGSHPAPSQKMKVAAESPNTVQGKQELLDQLKTKASPAVMKLLVAMPDSIWNRMVALAEKAKSDDEAKKKWAAIQHAFEMGVIPDPEDI